MPFLSDNRVPLSVHHTKEASDSLQALSQWKLAAVHRRKAEPGSYPCGLRGQLHRELFWHRADFCRSASQVPHFPVQSDSAPDYRTGRQSRYHRGGKRSAGGCYISQCCCHPQKHFLLSLCPFHQEYSEPLFYRLHSVQQL